MPLAWCLLLGIQLQEALWPKDWHTCHLCNCALFLCAGEKKVAQASVAAFVTAWIKQNHHRVALASKHTSMISIIISFIGWEWTGLLEWQMREIKWWGWCWLCLLSVSGWDGFLWWSHEGGESAAGIQAQGGEEVMNLEQVLREGEEMVNLEQVFRIREVERWSLL